MEAKTSPVRCNPVIVGKLSATPTGEEYIPHRLRGVIAGQCAADALKGGGQRFDARGFRDKTVYANLAGCGGNVVDAEEYNSCRWCD